MLLTGLVTLSAKSNIHCVVHVAIFYYISAMGKNTKQQILFWLILISFILSIVWIIYNFTLFLNIVVFGGAFLLFIAILIGMWETG